MQRRRNGRTPRAQQRREDGGQIEAALPDRANDAGEHLLRLGAAPRAIPPGDLRGTTTTPSFCPCRLIRARFTTAGTLVGQRVPILYTEHRRGELVAVCEMPDGSRAVVPVWMLDRVACATLSIGPPRCSLAALCNLRRPALAARVPPRRLREVSLTSLLGGRLLHPRLATIL